MASQELIDHIGKRYALGLHEQSCEIVTGTKVPTNKLTGETYDVYIIPHCNCWVDQDTDTITLEQASRTLAHIAEWSGKVQHGPKCARLYPEDIIYRGRKEKLWKNCNCWISDWKGEGMNINEKILEKAIANVLTNAVNYPKNITPHVLGTDMAGLIDKVKEAVIVTGLVEMDDWMMERPKVTRVELIDNSGRAYVKYGVSDVGTSLQDNGRTLKLFLRSS